MVQWIINISMSVISQTKTIAYQQEYFMLKAIIFVCIHDAPRGFTVSGQTKGKRGCPVCVDGTASVYLPSSRKLVFMQH
jgi:hypothetical protein